MNDALAIFLGIFLGLVVLVWILAGAYFGYHIVMILRSRRKR